MTVDEMIAKRQELGYSYDYISSVSGVPVSTIQKVFSKTTLHPRHTTLEALTKLFSANKDLSVPSYYNTFPEAQDDCSYVCESSAPYGLYGNYSKGNKTIEDYLALPEGTRVELIDGVFYDMAAPDFIHNTIIVSLGTSFVNFIKSNGGQCVPAFAPTDVQLDCDDKTMVQPDVMIICDRNKITRERVVGAPDFIVEILSPSNWRHDMIRKLFKYKKAGVREYWIVDPDALSILVYEFEKSDFPVTYSFNDKVPVGIWNGKCLIDFEEIFQQIEFLL